jgi:hypothetical protein
MMIKPQHTTSFGTIPYEQRLDRDRLWALREGSMHFEKESAVHKALQAITTRLEREQIPYAVAGGMAMFLYGYRRFTEDVAIVVTPDGLRAIHQRLTGLGYVPLFEGSKNLRDTQSGVRIDFLVTGQYPGDGKPKPIVFPDPSMAGREVEGIRCLALERLIELKLASGSAPGRRKDLGDVQEMIRVLRLPRALGEKLNVSVQALFYQLWDEAAQAEPPEQ